MCILNLNFNFRLVQKIKNRSLRDVSRMQTRNKKARVSRLQEEGMIIQLERLISMDSEKDMCWMHLTRMVNSKGEWTAPRMNAYIRMIARTPLKD